MIALRSLQPYIAKPRHEVATAHCEICGGAIGEVHRHVVELGTRGAMCTCQACAILFATADSGRQFRTVPDRVLTDRSFAMTAQTWGELGIPVGLVFFYVDSIRNAVVICYPGPAGITDAELDPAVWTSVSAATRLAATLEPDVEALIVRGQLGRSEMNCHLVPISAAYDLVGRLRSCWSGFTGGDAVHREIATFFADVERRGADR